MPQIEITFDGNAGVTLKVSVRDQSIGNERIICNDH